MKSFVVSALVILSSQAVLLRDTNSGSPAIGAPNENTMIGFIYPTSDMKDLWLDLNDDQRSQIKQKVYDMTLNFNHYDSKLFADYEFRFTPEYKVIEEAKRADEQKKAEAAAAAE